MTADLLQPYFDHMLDCFGPSRILWGGDWPVVNINSTLPDWIDLTRDLCRGLSDAEQDQIGQSIAITVYGL